MPSFPSLRSKESPSAGPQRDKPWAKIVLIWEQLCLVIPDLGRDPTFPRKSQERLERERDRLVAMGPSLVADLFAPWQRSCLDRPPHHLCDGVQS